MSFFLVAAFTAAPAVYFCYVVRRWDRLCERLLDIMMGSRPLGLFRLRQDRALLFVVDSNQQCVDGMIVLCLLLSFPLWMIATCTDLLRYLGYSRDRVESDQAPVRND